MSSAATERVVYVRENPDRAACESSPYPNFARDDYDRGHAAAVGILISPWATLAMFVSYLLGALVRDLDYWTVKK